MSKLIIGDHEVNDKAPQYCFHYTENDMRRLQIPPAFVFGRYEYDSISNDFRESVKSISMSTAKRNEDGNDFWSQSIVVNVALYNSQYYVEIETPNVKKFDFLDFKEKLDNYINDTYNSENKYKEFEFYECEIYRMYGDPYHFFIKVGEWQAFVFFERLKAVFMSMANYLDRAHVYHKQSSFAEFSTDLDKVFGLDEMRKVIKEKNINELLVAKKFSEVYNETLKYSTARPGEFLRIGKKLKDMGEYEEAIRFLNSETTVNILVHKQAQLELFDVLGTVMEYLSDEEKKNMKRTRILILYKFADSERDCELNKLFHDYLGLTFGSEIQYDISKYKNQTAMFELFLNFIDKKL
jgi:hypothetical protein